MNYGNKIEVKFYKMKNIEGNLYASINVVSPKKVRYGKGVVDLTKLDNFSKQDNGIFVGVEQCIKDSLYCAKGKEKVWKNGHKGYFNLFDSLASEQSQAIRELLCVDELWDAEWSDEDIVEPKIKLKTRQRNYKGKYSNLSYDECKKIATDLMNKLENYYKIRITKTEIIKGGNHSPEYCKDYGKCRSGNNHPELIKDVRSNIELHIEMVDHKYHQNDIKKLEEYCKNNNLYYEDIMTFHRGVFSIFKGKS